MHDGTFFFFLWKPRFGFLVCFVLWQLPDNYNGSYYVGLSGRWMTSSRMSLSTCQIQIQNYYKIMWLIIPSYAVKILEYPKPTVYGLEIKIFWMFQYILFFSDLKQLKHFCFSLVFFISTSTLIVFLLPVRNMVLTEIYFYTAYKYWVKAVKTVWDKLHLHLSKRDWISLKEWNSMYQI